MVPSDQDNSGRWVHKIEENLSPLSGVGEGKWIFKIPNNLRSGNRDSYSPKVVSIGPLHHGQPGLKAMEKHKYQYLQFCLRHNPNITEEGLSNSLNVLEETVRGLYDLENIDREFSREEFVRMMLLDGCFIVHLFVYVFAEKDEDTARTYDPKMFSTDFHDKDVMSDLKLIENQLPFFVLDHLYQVIFSNDEQGSTPPFFDVAVNYFSRIVKIGGNVIFERNGVKVKHLTDLLLNCFLPSTTYEKRSDGQRFDHLPTATELQERGVRIKRSENLNLLDITFTNGVLAIPKLSLTTSTESTFRNIIAMEQCHHPGSKYVTDYMELMNNLVDTPADVGVLKSSKVIISYYGNDEEVTQLFNSITSGVILRKSYYYRLIHEVNVYSNRGWPRLKAKVRKDYFSSPLTILSLFGALTLLVCTIVGAVFTVLSFTK